MNAPAAGGVPVAIRGDPPLLIAAAMTLLVAGLLFNIMLAWLNANVFPAKPGTVVAVQGMLLAGAFALGTLSRVRDRYHWLLVLWAMLVWWLIMSFFRQSIQVKYLGDVVALPLFAMLGAIIPLRRFVPLLIVLQVLIVAVGYWEAQFGGSFGTTFNVAGYYVNTRGIEATQFNTDLGGLYLNAVRPDGRIMFPQTGWLRVSSIFLEPVSLGNWTIVVTIFLITFWKQMGLAARSLVIASNILLIVMCDGRFAILTNAVVIGLALTSQWLPRRTPLLFPVVLYGALAAARALGVLRPGGDDLPGRLSKGMLYFERMTIRELFGMVGQVPSNMFDSGWAYFAQSQSIIGLTAFWMLLVLMMPARTLRQRRFLFALTGFFALSLPISNAFLSIKAASLLFALYGSLRRSDGLDEQEPVASTEFGRKEFR